MSVIDYIWAMSFWVFSSLGFVSLGNTVAPTSSNEQFFEVIYRATITEEGEEKHTYTGLTANKFKYRWSGHRHTFNNEQANPATISSLTHELKKNINFKIKWEILD